MGKKNKKVLKNVESNKLTVINESKIIEHTPKRQYSNAFWKNRCFVKVYSFLKDQSLRVQHSTYLQYVKLGFTKACILIKHSKYIVKLSDYLQDAGYTEKYENLLQSSKQIYHNVKIFMIASTAEEAHYRRRIEHNLSLQIKPATVFGGIVLMISGAFFVLWGGVAPLDSAAVAEGTIVLSGNLKTIQHLEGGLIEKIFIEEGSKVQEGERLIKLSDPAARATEQVILSQLRFAKALEKRLIAEEQSAEKVDFDDPVLDMTEAEVQIMVKNQKDLFDLNQKALRIQTEIAEQRVAQQNEEINALRAKEQAIRSRLTITQEQLNISTDLNKKGLEAKTRMLQFQERYAELNGELHSINASIAKAQEAIAETALHKINYLNEFKHKTAEKYKENRSHVIELAQKLQAARDVLKRTMILAPNSGIVTGLQYHTIGGVIPQGARIMDIVPQDDKLIAEVHVAPQFIESLYVGLEAKVQLNAYKSRLIPRVIGKVVYVSADKFTNEAGLSFYTVKIEFKEDSIRSVNADIKLHPGMPVTAFIVRGTRTFLQYMMSPIIDSFHRAFKEA